ncbi:TRAP transporter small permease [Caldalkalibacillus salinus]|uniref:TRAP transporter small permease n=1 Tax=Caldalkalibacillus salinus TaxID=2803787 RepID=UPI001921CB53|nr:TRAP transporter small permease [Caldalkalibacillus salinus]
MKVIVGAIVKALDKAVNALALLMLAGMVLIISLHVFLRQVFETTPAWSEEIALLFLVWISFIGIAVGFRDRLHIAVGLVVNHLPDKLQDMIDYLVKASILMVALIFIYYGGKFTMLMSNSTMAGTKLPTSYLYAVVPISGFLLLIYGLALCFQQGVVMDQRKYEEE